MIEKLQYITHEIEGLSHWEQAELVCGGGCRWVQLRVKEKTYEEVKYIAKKVQNVCIKYGATFIINDNTELAHDLLADGVHLGKSDMSPGDARKILGNNFIIGGTANTFQDILQLQNEGVDYFGLGPYRYTSTKQKLSPILGLDGYRMIISQCKEQNISIPIIAIGGITHEDIPQLMETGVFGLAISSAIHKNNNIIQATELFCNSLYKY